MVNMLIVYEIDTRSYNPGLGFTLGVFSFGVFKLNKNVNNNNDKNDKQVVNNRPTVELDDTKITADAHYLLRFLNQERKFAKSALQLKQRFFVC